MGRRDARHPRVRPRRRRARRLTLWLPIVLVIAILAAAGTAFLLDDDAADPETPAAVAPPPGLDLPEVAAPAPVAEAAAGTADPAKVRRAVAGLLNDADLGPHVLATVSALDGTLLYSRGTGEATPASTLKLLTATAALETLGPDHTFDTTVVADGRKGVVLVGGGDPLLSHADLRRLATQTAAKVSGKVRVGYDTSLFSGPDVNPHWPDSYIPDGVVAPIQPLWVDEGRDPSGFGRVDDPAATAAQEFAADLARAGVRVVGTPEERTARDTAPELARIASEPLDLIVENTISVSDNEAAEVLARQVGIATSGVGSFAAGVDGVLETMDALGVPTRNAIVHDGSGLSRQDRLDPDTLTAVLETAGSAEHPELRSVLTGLPVAGFTGSLEDRFEMAKAGRGLVRAKTGTLTGVSGLAGTVTDREGTPMVFAFLADRIKLVDTLDARAALDGITSALAACRCGRAGTVAP